MNERVKELALNAFQPINDMASEGIADRHTFDQAWFQLYNQQFANLIVLECAAIVQTYMSRWPEDCDLVVKMKEHFSVNIE